MSLHKTKYEFKQKKICVYTKQNMSLNKRKYEFTEKQNMSLH